MCYDFLNNASIPTMTDYIINQLLEKYKANDKTSYYTIIEDDDPDIYLTRKEIAMLVGVIRQVIIRELPKIRLLTDYLNKYINICCLLNIPFP